MISHSAPLWPVLLPDPAGAFGRHDDLSRLLGLQGVTLLLGVIKDLDAEETVRLTAWLTEGTVRSRLLVALYPGCRTTTRELDRLRTVAELHGDRLQVRLILCGSRSGAPGTVVWLKTAGEAGLLVTSPSASFGSLLKQGPVIAVLPTSASDAARFTGWCDELWREGVPLTQSTLAVPEIVWAQVDPAVRAAWAAYVAECEAVRQASHAERETSAGTDGEAATTPGSVPPESPAQSEPTDSAHERAKAPRDDHTAAESSSSAEFIGVRPIDFLAMDVERILAQGTQLRILESSRPEPLTVTLSPRLFGLDEHRDFGGVKRRMTYKLDVLDEAAMREMRRRRKELTSILHRMTLVLGGGTYWTTHAMQPKIDRARDAAVAESTGWLTLRIGASAESFVHARIAALTPAIAGAYREFQGEGPVPPNVFEDVRDIMLARLEGVGMRSFLPELAPAQVTLDLTTGGRGWGQAVELLRKLACFTREAVSRGGVDLLSDCEADVIRDTRLLNPADDYLLRPFVHPLDVSVIAKRELGWIEKLAKKEGSPREECESLLRIIGGEHYETHLQWGC